VNLARGRAYDTCIHMLANQGPRLRQFRIVAKSAALTALRASCVQRRLAPCAGPRGLRIMSPTRAIPMKHATKPYDNSHERKSNRARAFQPPRVTQLTEKGNYVAKNVFSRHNSPRHNSSRPKWLTPKAPSSLALPIYQICDAFADSSSPGDPANRRLPAPSYPLSSAALDA
jgi:hypothetical protein